MLKWLLLAIVVIGGDQASKLWINHALYYGQVIPVCPSFNLVLAYNKGAAFSFLHDAGGWQRQLFSGLAIAASAGIIWVLKKHHQNTLLAAAMALILGGALGNLIDRIAYGYVIDFIQVFYSTHYFPAFNIADSAITIGAGLMILESFKQRR